MALTGLQVGDRCLQRRDRGCIFSVGLLLSVGVRLAFAAAAWASAAACCACFNCASLVARSVFRPSIWPWNSWRRALIWSSTVGLGGCFLGYVFLRGRGGITGVGVWSQRDWLPELLRQPFSFGISLGLFFLSDQVESYGRPFVRWHPLVDHRTSTEDEVIVRSM